MKHILVILGFLLFSFVGYSRVLAQNETSGSRSFVGKEVPETDPGAVNPDSVVESTTKRSGETKKSGGRKKGQKAGQKAAKQEQVIGIPSDSRRLASEAKKED